MRSIGVEGNSWRSFARSSFSIPARPCRAAALFTRRRNDPFLNEMATTSNACIPGRYPGIMRFAASTTMAALMDRRTPGRLNDEPERRSRIEDMPIAEPLYPTDETRRYQQSHNTDSETLELDQISTNESLQHAQRSTLANQGADRRYLKMIADCCR